MVNHCLDHVIIALATVSEPFDHGVMSKGDGSLVESVRSIYGADIHNVSVIVMI